jgi:ABC-type phosphate/phosphonate transport system ATPase subunit
VLTARLSHRPVLPTLVRRFPPEDYERALGCLRRVGLAERAPYMADFLRRMFHLAYVPTLVGPTLETL